MRSDQSDCIICDKYDLTLCNEAPPLNKISIWCKQLFALSEGEHSQYCSLHFSRPLSPTSDVWLLYVVCGLYLTRIIL